MSGSAALSAARRRRASSSQMPGNTNTISQAGGGSYYGGGSTKQSLQGLMNQSQYPVTVSSPLTQTPAFTFPKEAAPNVPINIYENIELIKHQLAERTKVIQTQGSSLSVDKLRILQKQNEVQTQILKQKMAIAEQMEIVEQQKQQEHQQQYNSAQRQVNNQTPSNLNEPEFIYEKGIPRKNPKYRKVDEPVATIKPIPPPNPIISNISTPTPIPIPTRVSYQTPAPPSSEQSDRKLSPFVSMITDTGVIPPPVVILKSHDAKLEEHHYMIQDMLEQLDYLHSVITNKREELPSIKEETNDKKYGVKGPAASVPVQTDTNDEDLVEEEQEETELLMEVVMNDLTNSREFVEGIVDKIVNDTNLSEVIMKIEPIVKENQELRALIHSQQQMMNEMNTMLFRLLNQQNTLTEATAAVLASSSNAPLSNEEPLQTVYQDDGLNGDGLYQSEMTEIVLTPVLNKENDVGIEELVVEHIQALQEVNDLINEQHTDNDTVLHDDDQEQQEQQQQVDEQQVDEQQVDEQQVEEEQEQEEEEQEQEQQEQDEHNQNHYDVSAPLCIDSIHDEYSEMPHFPEPISLIVSEL